MVEKEYSQNKKAIESRNWNKGRIGLTGKMLRGMKVRSEKRGHEPPTFTLEELREWIFSQPNFDTLYDNWVASEYDRTLIPSCDRLDDDLGYSFSNIRLVTWKENYDKQHDKTRNIGRGNINHNKGTYPHWIATSYLEGKRVNVKRNKDKQVVVDALQKWNKEHGRDPWIDKIS